MLARVKGFLASEEPEKRAQRRWLKVSALNTIAIAVARVMGVAFSFILASAYSSSEYGYATYVISVASVVAIITQPFGQHVVPFLIGKYTNDQAEQQRMMDNAWFIFVVLIGLTALVAGPILLVLDRFSWELMAVFIGFTFFYAYHGLASGFMASEKFLGAYVGSNFLQLVLVVLVVYVFRVESAVPSIFIYGLSYFLPLVVLLVRFPFELPFRLAFDWPRIQIILRVFLPILAAHILYVVYHVFDVIMLETFTTRQVVGVYGLSKTLVSAFAIIPSAIALGLLPQLADPARTNRRQIIVRSVGFTTLINLVGAVVFLAIYPWLLQTFFADEYFIGVGFGALMVASAVFAGIGGIFFAVFTGIEKTHVEVMSRFVTFIVLLVAGVILIPPLQAIGAALATMLATMSALVVYCVYLLKQWWQGRRVSVRPA